MTKRRDARSASRQARPVATGAATAALVVAVAAPLVILAATTWSWVQGRRGQAVGPGLVDLGGVVVAMMVLALVLAGFLAWRAVRVPLVPFGWQRNLRSLFEVSTFGVGSMAQWTTTRPSLSLAHLRPVASVDQLAGLQVASPLGHSTRSARSSSGVAFNAVGVDVLAGDGLHHTARPSPAAPSAGTARRPTVARPAAGSGASSATGVVGSPTVVTEHAVQRGDTWWTLAADLIGDGRRWQEVRDLNLGRTVDGGRTIDGDTILRAGWVIIVPGGGTGPDRNGQNRIERGERDG